MKKFWQNVFEHLVKVAIVGGVVLLWQFNTRLTRIEERLGIRGDAGMGEVVIVGVQIQP